MQMLAHDWMRLISSPNAWKCLKNVTFNESFMSNWDVKKTDTWKWSEFYLEFSLFLIGKKDDKEAKKALAAGVDKKKNDADHKTANQTALSVEGSQAVWQCSQVWLIGRNKISFLPQVC
eukprot:TRINITY_DN78226_c0_g1_i1.p1 TRINITY_DN78226_c0_g1~~TRINITY_DN78226_c0_g1_i1.p1  ORF type:complete len:119 (+),score=28.80 TRINITY_DN78226_c0_g1_i1:55-411(+)